MKKILFTTCITLITFLVQAEVSLPKVFADHMVLQRDMDIPVWGWADPKERVEVIFQDKTYKTRADQTGKWKVEMNASSVGGPFTLTIKGKNTISLQDVLVGDVWLLGGQSNMEWPLKQTNGADDSIKLADYPNIRF